MDRISKALEQAKQGVRNARFDPVAGDYDTNAPRQYAKTRSVSLSPELLREHRIVTGGNYGPIVDTYGLLRTRVLNAMRKNNWKTLGITSPDPSVGKTVTAINLAVSIAMDHNYSTLLVDCDLRRPGIAVALGMELEYGLSDFLVDDRSVEDVFVHPQIDHLVIAPTKHVTSGSSELLSSPRMNRFIRESSDRYPDRLVLFDLPPVLVGDDVIAISQQLDALLFVVADGKTQSKELGKAIELLHDINILGVVLNKGKVASKQYDYYR